MSNFTERNGMRAPVELTETITIKMYAVLFDCCERYYDYIAWRYPSECEDGNGCCGLDFIKFNDSLTFEIPSLFKNYKGFIAKPFDELGSYDQYALLDFIELIYAKVRDIMEKRWHDFCNHYDFRFSKTNEEVAKKFREEINDIFKKTGLLYTLTKAGSVERINANSPLTKDVETKISEISEKGTKELLEEAIKLYKTPNPSARKDAVDKIWDAFERLKTYYDKDKKKSVKIIINDISGGKNEFKTLFNDEFSALKNIGNNFCIRHHETDKTDITDLRYYDYFFNRCLSLIALVIQYLH